ncbi:MAG: hypothetical protein SOZ73_03340, partial [Campylobacter sp.]|nr:hypothetical protein [Campylobacter sp.]
TGKANTQAVVSEVVTSSRIFIDDILSEPWNSAITNGFTDRSGAVLYSGILQAESRDPRFVNTKKYFRRTLAKDKDGRAIQAARLGSSCDSRSGINCKNEVETKISANGKESKNALDFNIKAEVKFINITENKTDKKITATFNNTAAAGTTNAILVSTTATGKGGGNIIDDVNEIRLNGFAFNIGTESR